MYPTQLDENAALLAQHYAEAGDDAKTLDHELKLSGRIEREHWIEQARSLSEAE